MERDAVENASFLLEDEEEGMSSATNSTEIVEEVEVHQDISFEELEMYRFCPGVLYWKKSDGSLVKLRSSGDFLDHNYLEKFKKSNASLMLHRVSHPRIIEEGIELLEKFKNSSRVNLKVTYREKFLSWLKRYFWDEGESSSLLDLTHIYSKCFYGFNSEQEKHLKELSIDLYKRSSLLANVMVSYALVLGYNDYKFLKDIYHLSFLFDVGFEKDNLTTHIWQALESSRGTEESVLENQKLSESEKETIRSHVGKGFENSQAKFKRLFNNPSLIKLIKLHHEKMNGAGFPYGLNESECSDLDMLIIFSQTLFSYGNYEYKSLDGNGFLRNIIYQNTSEEFLSKRLKTIVKDVFTKTPSFEESNELEMGA